MRCAAVEAGATQDPELAKERDEAIRKLARMSDLLEGQGVFFCTSCEKLYRCADRKLNAGGLSWCDDCARGERAPARLR